MNKISGLKFHTESREELLPDFAADFPYIASYVEFSRYTGHLVPWHWHKAIELFYLESGKLEYQTPKGKTVFSAGSGGLVNSNVLHMTTPPAPDEKSVQLLHIFDTSLIAGSHGSRIEKKYILPITAAPQIELFALHPDIPAHAKVLELIKEAFRFSNEEIGFELKIREALSAIWIMLYELLLPHLETGMKSDKNDERLKTMMIYIHEHFADKLRISDIASAAYLSERECFRIFHDYLHTTPTEYIRNYRLQKACQMLAGDRQSITDIGRACGLGSSSYFGKIFREYADCTPVEYRKKWQDSIRNCPK